MGGDSSGKLQLKGVGWKSEVSHPLSKLSLPKPVVWLYQPIKLPVATSLFASGFYGQSDSDDPRLKSRTLSGQSRQGAIFRQYKDRVEVITDPLMNIEFDTVTGDDRATQGLIAASVYKAQSELFEGSHTSGALAVNLSVILRIIGEQRSKSAMLLPPTMKVACLVFGRHAVRLIASSPRTPPPPVVRARRHARDGRRRRASSSPSRGRGASGPAWG